MNKQKLGIIALLGFMLSACSNKQVENKYYLKNQTKLDCGFDTICRLDAFVLTDEEFNTYYNVMIDDFSYYNKLFDIYHTYDGINNIKTINDNAGISKVKVEQPIIDLIFLAKDISELSNGAFDITSGSLLKIWHNYREEGKILNENGEYGYIPAKESLSKAANYIGYDFLEIDDENNTIFITDKNVSLDVGAIGKGFAVENVAKHLEELGLKYGSVNGGGNQRMIGTKADGSGWSVGVTDPRTSNSIIAVLPNQKDVSAVTSGDYQNYYLAENDLRLSHIIDPSTLMPANKYNSVSISITNSGLADCLSTALFVLDFDKGMELINKVNEKYSTDIIAIWVSDKPINQNSIKSISEVEQYITVTDNFKDQLITK